MGNVFGVSVHIGVHNESSISPQIRGIDKIIMHPMYVPPPKYVNDIALIRLSSPVDLAASNNYAGITCLPQKTVTNLDYPKVDTRLAVIGWGRLLESGIRPTVLRQVRVKTLANNDSRCNDSIVDPERQFCAMVDDGGKDSCQGKFIIFSLI
jgi:trypsin